MVNAAHAAERLDEDTRTIAEEVQSLLKRFGGPSLLSSPLRELDQAVAQAGEQGMEVLVDEVFRAAIEFDARVLLRVQTQASRLITEWDRNQSQGVCPPPKPLVQEFLPRVERIQKHLMGLVKAYGTARHAIGLSKETANVRGAARQLREQLRVISHPVSPAVESAAGPGERKAAG